MHVVCVGGGCATHRERQRSAVRAGCTHDDTCVSMVTTTIVAAVGNGVDVQAPCGQPGTACGVDVRSDSSMGGTGGPAARRPPHGSVIPVRGGLVGERHGCRNCAGTKL